MGPAALCLGIVRRGAAVPGFPPTAFHHGGCGRPTGRQTLCWTDRRELAVERTVAGGIGWHGRGWAFSSLIAEKTANFGGR